MIRRNALLLVCLFTTAGVQAATTAQIDDARAKSLAFLVSQQKGDGSWRDASGNGIQATASALEALAEAGMKTGYVPGAGVSWLLNAEATSTDSLARQIAALKRMGAPADHLISKLTANKNLIDGRYGAYKGYQASMPDTALAFDALLAANTNMPTDAQLSAITGMQAADGGWPYRLTAPGGAKSAVIPTAYAVLVLSHYIAARSSAATVSETSITNGINWLLNHKKTDGGFAEDAAADGTYNPTKPGHVFESSLVRAALVAAQGVNIAAAKTTAALQAQSAIDDFLVTRQGVDGAWGADPFLTALTASALPAVTLADGDQDGLPDVVEVHLGHNMAVADSRDLPKGNGNPNVSAAPSEDGDVPLPLWSLVALGAGLMGATLRKTAANTKQG